MPEKQNTIKAPVTVSGTGLHTGKKVDLTFHPAPIHHGYRFKRSDLDGSPVVKALVDYVVDTERGTTLEFKGIRIATVEHTLAALVGLGIDNVLIELNCVEPPIMDGSAKYFVEALLEVGIQEQEADREYIELDRVIQYKNQEKKIELMAIPYDHFKVSTLIDFESHVLGTQNAVMEHIDRFSEEIAPSRTFVFLHEMEYLLDNNLIKGGDLSNAIVFVEDMVSDEQLARLAKVFNKPDVKVLQQGILNNLKLHFPNEPARHKLLDVIGDMALVGKPIKAHIITNRTGHEANVQMAGLIKNYEKELHGKAKIPNVDLNATPVFTIEDIQRYLPHRFPFLLIDKIMEISDTYIIGVKNVTMNEAFFTGHFPDEPVMPGVLQVETMAQTGGMFVLNSVQNPEDYATYLLRLEDVRFRQKVKPGDTIIIRIELIEPIRRGICYMQGQAFVGNNVVMEARMMAQIVKKEIK
ncbi:MAG: bifunctional UDP-3-O-[3-hydroxymyristoyl] N-acetylglucosamine deacetylase/3-hydroxyacyl-ACP dehydratase [Bacteroidales bacterium]|nr:bifunctional UDP-3-O-[3-hydroxymyristoyl] N-acetylglucosamine deacetylase/3-hydroxyacyl-ACP dehydratase [Bacteroidales bacterium]